VRLGKQVISWGESTFIMNGINAANPADVSAFRRPGAEIKEGLIPVNMFYIGQSLTDNLSMEAFYQIEWNPTVLENCGTFFSQPDVVAPGCDDNLAVLINDEALIGTLNTLAAGVGLGVRSSAYGEGLLVERGADRNAQDDGQWGLAFRYMFEPLDTEFGAYFMNYHSRMPIFSGAGPDAATQATINTFASGIYDLSP